MIFKIVIVCSVLTLFTISIINAYPNGWSDDILLTPEDNRMRDLPDIAIDNYNNVWVVWDSADFMSGAGEILFTKLDSFGACIIPETNVSNNASFSITPEIAVDLSNNIHL